MNDEINMHSLVLLHYSIALTNGSEIESSFDDEPVEITMGEGDITDGMELAIYGLKEGDSQTLTLTPEQGFGLRDEDNIHAMPLSDFPDDLQPEIGLSYSFESPEGDEIPGTVVSLKGDTAEIDFNHPLAGHEIVFAVKILGVNNAHAEIGWQKAMDIYLANPRGFCAGVDRAIDIVERALELFSAPIYVRHEVVHNRYVVNDLMQKGAIFVEDLNEIPDGATVIFSAHGVSQKVRNEADSRDLRVFDATCPLVTKVHLEVARHEKNIEDVILIGHAGHPEVEGTLGQYKKNSHSKIYLVETVDDIDLLEVKNPHALAYVTQTTLSVDDTKNIIEALRDKFPDIQGPRKDDICYATQNRQDAVRELADKVDVFLVIGSANSSNSNRLRELSEKQNVTAYLIDGAEDIDNSWFDNARSIGVTAGASAPEVLVQAVITSLENLFETTIITNEKATENVRFQLPKELRQ